METRECNGTNRRARWLLLLAAAFVGVSATTKVVVDALRWREQAPAARSVALQTGSTQRQKKLAIVTMQHEALELLALLRRLAEDADPTVAANAGKALDNIIGAAQR